MDAGDAKYVQAIHTSIVLGSGVEAGHADFYIDGGVAQPGCATQFLRRGLLGSCAEMFLHKFARIITHSTQYILCTYKVAKSF